MRVRKAVPEGYKTTKRILDPNTLYSGTGGTGRSAELVPYCGISKVGGYMAQPHTQPPSLPDNGNGNDILRNGMLFEDNDEGLDGDANSSVPPPPSSQKWSRGAKRGFIHDEEEENEDGVRRNNESLGLVGMEVSMALRPIAQARNRPRRDGTTRLKGACEGDFGEAPFLRDWCEAMDF